MTHCILLPLISACKPIDVNLKQRFCKFAESMFTQGSSTIKVIALAALTNPLSIFCNNHNEIISHHDNDYSSAHRNLYHEWTRSITENTRHESGVLRELIDIRDGRADIPVLDADDINNWIEDISVFFM